MWRLLQAQLWCTVRFASTPSHRQRLPARARSARQSACRLEWQDDALSAEPHRGPGRRCEISKRSREREDDLLCLRRGCSVVTASRGYRPYAVPRAPRRRPPQPRQWSPCRTVAPVAKCLTERPRVAADVVRSLAVNSRAMRPSPPSNRGGVNGGATLSARESGEPHMAPAGRFLDGGRPRATRRAHHSLEWLRYAGRNQELKCFPSTFADSHSC